MNTKFLPLPRRRFLASAAFSTFAIVVKTAGAAERPPVTTPRATAGDTAVEPDWAARLTVTVGTRAADLVGDDARVLQAAVA